MNSIVTNTSLSTTEDPIGGYPENSFHAERSAVSRLSVSSGMYSPQAQGWGVHGNGGTPSISGGGGGTGGGGGMVRLYSTSSAVGMAYNTPFNNSGGTSIIMQGGTGRPGSNTSAATTTTRGGGGGGGGGATKHSGRTANFSRLQLSLMGSSQKVLHHKHSRAGASVSGELGAFAGGGPGIDEAGGAPLSFQGSELLMDPSGHQQSQQGPLRPLSSHSSTTVGGGRAGTRSSSPLHSRAAGGGTEVSTHPSLNDSTSPTHHTSVALASSGGGGLLMPHKPPTPTTTSTTTSPSTRLVAQHSMNRQGSAGVRVVPVVSESTVQPPSGGALGGPLHVNPTMTAELMMEQPAEVGMYESPELVFIPLYQTMKEVPSQVQPLLNEEMLKNNNKESSSNRNNIVKGDDGQDAGNPPPALLLQGFPGSPVKSPQFMELSNNNNNGTTATATTEDGRGSPPTEGGEVIVPFTPASYTSKLFGRVAPRYNVDPTEELNECRSQGDEMGPDTKISARLLLNQDRVLIVSAENEVMRYIQRPNKQDSNNGGVGSDDDEEDDGACGCDEYFIGKDYLGADCSRYHAHQMFKECGFCHRRPGCFLCLHCLQAFCPLHVPDHYSTDPEGCTLYMNILDIMTGFDRIFWCEKCKRFTWKYTEVFDAFVDQIAYTRGTYFDEAVRDIHCVWYQTVLRAPGDQSSSSSDDEEDWADEEREGWQMSIDEDPVAAAAAATAAAAISNTNPRVGSGNASTRNSGALGGGGGGEKRRSSETRRKSSRSCRNSLTPMYELVHRSFRHGSSLRCSLEVVAGASGGGGGVHPRLSGASGGAAPGSSPPRSQVTPPLLPPPSAPERGFESSIVSAPQALPGLVPSRLVTASTPVLPPPITTAVAAANVSASATRSAGTPNPGCDGVGSSSTLHQEASGPCEEEAAAAAGPSSPMLGVGKAVSHLNAISAGVQGWRTTQEDAEAVFLVGIPALRRRDEDGEKGEGEEALAQHDPVLETMQMAVYCVFDGHGGDVVAKLAAQNFETHLRRAIARTRTDDIRARALLYVLEDESTHPPQLPVVGHNSSNYNNNNVATSPRSIYGSTRAFQSQPSASSAVLEAMPPHLMPSPASPLHAGPPPSAGGGLKLSPGVFTEGFCESSPASPTVPVAFIHTVEDNATNMTTMPPVLPCTINNLKRHFSSELVEDGKSSPHEAQGTSPHTHGNLGGGDEAGAHHHRHRHHHYKTSTNNTNTNSKNGSAPPPLRVSEFINEWQREHEQSQQAPLLHPSSTARSLPTAEYGSPLGGESSTRQSTSYSPPRGGGGGSEMSPVHGTGPFSSSSRHWGRDSSVYSTLGYGAPTTQVTRSEMEFLRCYFASIMEDALFSLDKSLETSEEGQRGDFNTVGCTACVVGITRNFILCANLGDSGAAVYDEYGIESISVKHRITDPTEQDRIQGAGYAIRDNRIEGLLAVPRALGDFDFKQCGGKPAHLQAVIAVPDVTVQPVPSEGDGKWGVIVACDGVWDTMTMHQVHYALTHTDGDPMVAMSVTEAVIRGRELTMEKGIHKKTAAREEGGISSTAANSSPLATQHQSEQGVTALPTPLNHRENTAGSGELGSSKTCEEAIKGEGTLTPADALVGGASGPQSNLNIPLLIAATGVFAQSVAPEDNMEGIGLDNCSLIIIQNQPQVFGGDESSEATRKKKAAAVERRARRLLRQHHHSGGSHHQKMNRAPSSGDYVAGEGSLSGKLYRGSGGGGDGGTSLTRVYEQVARAGEEEEAMVAMDLLRQASAPRPRKAAISEEISS